MGERPRNPSKPLLYQYVASQTQMCFIILQARSTSHSFSEPSVGNSEQSYGRKIISPLFKQSPWTDIPCSKHKVKQAGKTRKNDQCFPNRFFCNNVLSMWFLKQKGGINWRGRAQHKKKKQKKKQPGNLIICCFSFSHRKYTLRIDKNILIIKIIAAMYYSCSDEFTRCFHKSSKSN